MQSKANVFSCAARRAGRRGVRPLIPSGDAFCEAAAGKRPLAINAVGAALPAGAAQTATETAISAGQRKAKQLLLQKYFLHSGKPFSPHPPRTPPHPTGFAAPAAGAWWESWEIERGKTGQFCAIVASSRWPFAERLRWGHQLPSSFFSCGGSSARQTHRGAVAAPERRPSALLVTIPGVSGASALNFCL